MYILIETKNRYNMNILFVGLRNKKHSSAGGYDRIVNMPNTSTILSEQFPFSNIPLGYIGKGFKTYILRILRRFNICIPYFLSYIYRYKYDVTHLFYGEFVIPFIPYLKSKKHKVVATIHLDIETYRFPKVYIWFFKQLDGIIVLSTNQVRILKEKYGLNSTYIPHGFSRPIYKERKAYDINGSSLEDNCINIFVGGSNYRDFDLLHEVLRYSIKNRLNIKYHLVGVKQILKNEFISYSNTLVYNRLTDDEYFTLLNHCDYNFLPVSFATANNVLLEAQFCSVSSILPDIQGITDYAAPSPLNIFYQSKEELFSILSMLSRPKLYNSEFKDFAQQFEWNNIYKLLNKYYESL